MIQPGEFHVHLSVSHAMREETGLLAPEAKHEKCSWGAERPTDTEGHTRWFTDPCSFSQPVLIYFKVTSRCVRLHQSLQLTCMSSMSMLLTGAEEVRVDGGVDSNLDTVSVCSCFRQNQVSAEIQKTFRPRVSIFLQAVKAAYMLNNMYKVKLNISGFRL